MVYPWEILELTSSIKNLNPFLERIVRPRWGPQNRVRVKSESGSLSLCFTPLSLSHSLWFFVSLTYPIMSNRKALRSIEGDFIAAKQFGNRIFRIEEREAE